MNNYIYNTIVLMCIALFTSCSAMQSKELNKDLSKYRLIKNPLVARITYYSGPGEKVAFGKVAIEGISVAAHPKYKFNTKIYIPELKGKVGNGEFIIQDRGPAVTNRKASRGKTDVFDVYVKYPSTLRRLAHILPEYMNVYVLN